MKKSLFFLFLLLAQAHYATAQVAAINKWKQHIWNNFAARMLWSATDDYGAANHHPQAVLYGDRSLKCIFKKVKAGSTFDLDAGASTDPDGDELTYHWSVYIEPSSYKGEVKIEGSNAPKCQVHIPADAKGTHIHIILELTDVATPALTAYRRVVLTIN